MSRLGNEDVGKTSMGILGALKESEGLNVKKVVLSDGKSAVETKILTEDVDNKTPVAQVLDTNGTPFDIYEIEGKYVDANGVEVEDEMLVKAGLKEDTLEEKQLMRTENGYSLFHKINNQYVVTDHENKEVKTIEANNSDEAKNMFSDFVASMKEGVETPEGSDQKVPGEGKEPLTEETAKWAVLAYVGKDVGFVKKDGDNYATTPNQDEAILFASEDEAKAATEDINQFFGGKAKLVPTITNLYEEDECECEERIVEGLQILNIKGNTVLLKESKGYIVGKDYDKATGVIKEAEEYKTEKVANKAFERLASK